MPLPRKPVTSVTGSRSATAERRDKIGVEGVERPSGEPLRRRAEPRRDDQGADPLRRVTARDVAEIFDAPREIADGPSAGRFSTPPKS